MTWASDKTWIVTGTVLVKGGTLTIEPGTKVLLAIGSGIRQVGGTVVAEGVAFCNIDFDGRMDYAEAEKDEVRLDTDVGGLRVAAAEEPLTFSTLWGESPAAQVKVSYATAYNENADVVSEAGPVEGEYWWQANAPGYYMFTHVAGDETLTAAFVVMDPEATELIFDSTITESADWPKDKVILVDGTVTVKSGATLTIEPGAVVKFMDGAGIVCEAGGRCVADGVIFTHANDDTVGGDTLFDGTTAPLADKYVLNGVSGDDATQYRYHPDPTVTLSGTISKNEVWRGFNVYHVTGDITIPNGVTLTVEPGAIIKFDPGLSLTVNSGAALNAIGTRAQPIVFTSIRDDDYGGDTNGDGTKTMPYPGDWTKICVNGGTANFDYAHILYSSRNQTTGAINMPSGGKVVFGNGEIAHCAYDAVVVESGNFYMTNSVIRDCLLAFRHWARDPIVNCVIYDCGRLTQGGGQNFVNCIFSHITETWEAFGFPQNGTSYRNCVFWNEDGSVLTGEGTQDAMTVCGKNGNIWADPRFLDPDNGDFRLDDKSPCVDAGLASAAPVTDSFGQPRVNAPDIGICEVLPRNVTSDIDLMPQSVTADADVVSGQLLTIRWTVANQGGADIDAEWRDTVSLVSENGRTVTLGDKVISRRLVAGGTTSCYASFIVPAISEGAWYPRVNVNSYRDVFEGALGGNNTLTGESPINITTTTLDLSVVNNGIIDANSPTVLKLAFGENDDNRMVKFDVPAGVKVTWGFGFMPQGASKSGAATATGDGAMFRVPDDASEVYVVLESDKTATYNLATETTKMTITGVSPTTLPSSGTTTLTVTGAGFGEDCAVSLSCAVGSYLVQSIAKDNGGNLIATVDCAALSAGQTYAVRVESGGNVAELPSAVCVIKNVGKGVLEARLVSPSQAREERMTVGYVEYENVGTADMPPPIFKVTGKRGTLVSVDGDRANMKESIRLVGIGASRPHGVLKVRETMRVPFYFTVKGEYELSLDVIDASSKEVRESVFVSWSEFCEAMGEAATRLNAADENVFRYESVYALAMKIGYGLPTGNIAGTLLDFVSEGPMVNETLGLFDTNDTRLATCVTDEEGRFRFDSLPEGETFIIESKTCQMSHVAIATGAAEGEIVYGAPFANVLCRVKGANEDPVSVVLIDDNGDVTAMIETNGCFVACGIEDGEYVAHVEIDGYHCVTGECVIAVYAGIVTNEIHDIVAVDSGHVKIKVTSEDGEPLSLVSCALFNSETGYSCAAVTGGDGYATFNVPAGAYSFTVADGYVLTEEVTVSAMVHATATSSVVVSVVPFCLTPPMGSAPLQVVASIGDTNRIGFVTKCQWDFNGDGVWDEEGREATNVYATTGIRTVKAKFTILDVGEMVFTFRDAVDVWDGDEVEFTDGTLLLAESSGYVIKERDEGGIVLEMTGDSLPYAISDGMRVVDPNDLTHPMNVDAVEAIDEHSLKLTVSLSTIDKSFKTLRLSSVKGGLYSGKARLQGLDLSRLNGEMKLKGGANAVIGSLDKDWYEVKLNGTTDFDAQIKFSANRLEKFSCSYGWSVGFDGKIGYASPNKGRGGKTYIKRSRASKLVRRTIPGTDWTLPAGFMPIRVVGYYFFKVDAHGEVKASYSGKTTHMYTRERGWIKSNSPASSDVKLIGEGSVAGGVEVEVGIGVGKTAASKDYGFNLGDLSAEFGLKADMKVEWDLDEYKPDKMSAWAGPYFKLRGKLAHVKVGKFDFSLASIEALSLEWKIFDWEWTTPMPDFSIRDLYVAKDERNNQYPVEFSASTSANDDSIFRSRYWDLGGVSEGGDETVRRYFPCYPDDKVTYDIRLYEGYSPNNIIAQYIPTFTKARWKKLTVYGYDSDKDKEPCIEMEDFKGGVPHSCDPNEMVGPLGVGDPETERFVKPGEWMTYTIYFENKADATAAAQEVYVSEALSANLDWSTFEMAEVAFGDQIDLGLAGAKGGSSDATMTGTNLIVRTSLALDETTGLATWYMRIVDPTTDTGWPMDILAGFLPPNDPETHCGEGHITYRVKVRDDAPACERINASATIVFDYNDPIVTDPAWWNTVSPIEGYLQAGEYFKATLAELGYDVPTDGTAYSVVAKGLPAGLQLKYNATVKDKKGRVVKAAKSEWWIEGVPTAAVDFFTNPPYLVITANGETKTEALPVEVAAQDVVDLGELALGQSVNTNGWLTGVGKGWAVSGLPTGLKYATKKVTKTTGSGKKKVTTTVAEAYAVYGTTTKAGLFTITAKKKAGAFYETKKFRVLVKPAAVDKALFGNDLTNITTMAYVPINWDLTGSAPSVPPVPFVPSSIGGSLAKVTGLPTGLSFAASDAYGYTNAKKKTGKYLKQKGQTIVGTPTKPGTYVVTFTKNVKEKAKGKTKTVAKTAQILWVVTQNDAELSLGFNTMGGVIESGVVGLKYTDLMAFAATSNATVTASGLPAGITLANLGGGQYAFTGFTAKAGTYLVTVKATLNGKTVTQRVALKVDGLPAWAKGTFNGYVAGEDGATNGLATVTVSAAGKVSGKFYDRGTNWTFTAASYTDYDDAASAYTVPIEAKFAYKVTEKVKGKKKTVTKYVTRSFTLAVVDNGELGGTATLVESGVGSTVHARQNLWGSTYKALGKTLFSSKSGKKTLAYKTFAIKSTDPAGEAMGLLPTETLSLKVTTAGAVTATMSFDTGKRSKGKAVVYKATCSTVVIPLTTPDAKAAEFKGIVYLYFAPSTKNSFTGFAGAAPF